MKIKHNNKNPKIDKTTYIAPNAVICGDVTIGRNCRIMFGVTIIAEGSSISIGDNCVVFENAVLRSTKRFDLTVESNVLIGPNAHIVGSYIESNVFIATGASIFHGSRLSKNSEVRINGVVHLKTVLPENSTVPIGWIAVGDPVKLFPPGKHDEIWEVQKPLNFPLSVYGVERKENGESIMPEIMNELVTSLGTHHNDEIIE